MPKFSTEELKWARFYHIILICLVILLFLTPGLEGCAPKTIGDGLRVVLGGDLAAAELQEQQRPHGPSVQFASGRTIETCEDLFCDFTGPCRWHNVKDEQDEKLDFLHGSGSPDINKWIPVSKTPDTPDGDFGAVATLRRPNSAEHAKLVSDPISCQRGSGMLTFNYYVSPKVKIRGCWRYVGNVQYETCSPPVMQGRGTKAVVDIPDAIDRPFELVIEASDFTNTQGGGGGLAFIDDIEYCAVFCNEEFDGIEESVHSNQLEGDVDKDKGPCKLLTCNFHAGDKCLYRDGSQGSGIWRVNRVPMGNPLTGIRTPPKGFGQVLTSEFPDSVRQSRNPGMRHVLESEEVVVRSNQMLSFKRYQATVGTRIRVCLEVIDEKCEWVSPPLSRGSTNNVLLNLQWREEVIRLPPGMYKVFFVSDYDGSGNFNTGYNGIADIRVVDAGKNPIC